MKKKTEELLELMKNSPDYQEYLETNRGEISVGLMKVNRALASLLAEREMKKSEVIERSGIETHYAYQIFSGAKVPTRDKMLMLCVGFRLSPDEAQNLLKLTGYSALYGRELRDNAVLFGLTKNLSVVELNGILYDLGLDLLL
ncbi:MAG: hypothetical protein MJ070_05870 [Lachnospiraceae bacterium]|nr:hypothetical protein [Lachnospiraceae bacterium]